MDTKRTVLISIIVLTLVGGIAAGVYLVSKRQSFREKAAPATTLYIQPSTQNKSAGSSFTFEVMMDTGSNSVIGVDIRLTFDASVAEILSVQKGSGISVFDSVIADTFDNLAGTVSYIAYSANKSKAVSGSAIEVLVVSGRIKDTASGERVTFDFDSRTKAAGLGENENVLQATSPGVIVLSGDSDFMGTPSPSPTSLPSLTPTPVGGAQINIPTKTPLLKVENETSTSTPPMPQSGFSTLTLASIGLGVSLLIVSSLFVF